MSDLAAPFDSHRDVVRPEWIDHNGHMNVGYYLVVFDFATRVARVAIWRSSASSRRSMSCTSTRCWPIWRPVSLYSTSTAAAGR